jgi:hypothetical protein
MLRLVIPAKAGIQGYQSLQNLMDPGFHRGDDLVQIHQISYA